MLVSVPERQRFCEVVTVVVSVVWLPPLPYSTHGQFGGGVSSASCGQRRSRLKYHEVNQTSKLINITRAERALLKKNLKNDLTFHPVFS